MSQLIEVLSSCQDLVFDVVEGKKEIKVYVEALKKVMSELLATDREVIETLDLDANIVKTLGMDRAMIEGYLKEEKDRLSLLSTLCTYMACKKLENEEHSPFFMDTASKLRKKLEEFYGTEVEGFCS